MEIEYLSTRGELTTQLIRSATDGYTCYRVRTSCHCRPLLTHLEKNLKANQRNGVLVIKNDKVVKIFVKCKLCAANQNLTP